MRLVLRPMLRTIWPIRCVGLEHVPRHGGVILAPNHLSFFDSVVLLGLVPRRLSFVGKSEYMEKRTTRWLLPALGMIPVDRSGGRAAVEALDSATRALDRGHVLAIFPEGTRARDEFVHKGRTGVARLAMRTGASVIPVGMVGTDRLQPAGTRVPRPFRRCEVRFGAPVALDEYLAAAGDGRVYRRLTDELMERIAVLAERPYLDRYAGAPQPVAAPAS